MYKNTNESVNTPSQIINIVSWYIECFEILKSEIKFQTFRVEVWY